MHSRQIHTPLTIGSFFIASITGVLIFFELSSGGIRATHEWMSLFFVVASSLHIYANKRPFIKYFTSTPLLIILVSVLSGISLYAVSFNDLYAAEASFKLLTNIEISTLLPILDMSQEEFLVRLKTIGVTELKPEQSLHEIAQLHDMDVHDILELLISP
ncbi:DUF4405 domain-containing protein [Neptuniibacter sp. SY11_33]|uniref:DUF4405 domain-containing protein n=1 Tax=Neptuniibacter sp. SY11_33 TaxID=3398215 RepID=UPI0039F570F9